MNINFKRLFIPAVAAIIISGGATGAILASAAGKDKPTEQSEKQEQADLMKQAKISKKESIKIALEKVPGSVKDVELEDEDGTVVFGVEVKVKDGSKQDVKIDAQTGKIVKVEKDDEDKNENEMDDNEENDNE